MKTAIMSDEPMVCDKCGKVVKHLSCFMTRDKKGLVALLLCDKCAKLEGDDLWERYDRTIRTNQTDG